MKKEIIINSALNEDRVAITEDGRLAEYFIELPDKERYIGNIYLGRVSKIVTGINAAFVNIGLRSDAFLHFSDVDETLENPFDEDDGVDDDEDESCSFCLQGIYPGHTRASSGSQYPGADQHQQRDLDRGDHPRDGSLCRRAVRRLDCY